MSAPPTCHFPNVGPKQNLAKTSHPKNSNFFGPLAKKITVFILNSTKKKMDQKNFGPANFSFMLYSLYGFVNFFWFRKQHKKNDIFFASQIMFFSKKLFFWVFLFSKNKGPTKGNMVNIRKWLPPTHPNLKFCLNP